MKKIGQIVVAATVAMIPLAAAAQGLTEAQARAAIAPWYALFTQPVQGDMRTLQEQILTADYESCWGYLPSECWGREASIKVVGGFAKSVGMRVLTTPHGLGYAKVVIVVDADVDPFNLDQVMWAISVRANPAGDVMILPNLAENLLDPAGQPNGMAHKMIIDATTPIPPDRRGNYGQVLDTPERTELWQQKLTTMIAALKK